MVAFGGSGPVHALAIARKLRIRRVIFPIGAGVVSALGLLVSPLGFEISRSRRNLLADLDARIRAGVPRVRWAVEPYRRRATVATRRGNTPCASPPP